MVAVPIDRPRRKLPEQFPWRVGDEALPAIRRMTSVIESRLSALEDQRFDVDDTIQALKENGLLRISETIDPVLQEVLTRLRTASDIFEATSSSPHAYTTEHIEDATLVFVVDEGRRNSFTTQGYVRLQPAAEPMLEILASVDDYDWETGDLTVTVFSMSAQPPGDPVTYDEWDITPALAEGIQEVVGGGGLAEAIEDLEEAVAARVLTSLLAQPNGVATLDGDGKLLTGQRFAVVGGGDLTSVAGVAGDAGNVPTAGLYAALGITAAINAATAGRVPNSRTVSGAGLVAGGGALSGDLVLTVSKAAIADFVKPTEDGKAITPKVVWDASAPLAQDYTATLNIDLAVGRLNHIVAAITGPMSIVLTGGVPGMSGWIKGTASAGDRVITVQVGSVAAVVHGMLSRQWTIPSGETWKFHYSFEVGGAEPVIVWGVEKAIT